ncbi:hypothetical protein F2Q70_00042468 [Brassica cretica]|uniref:Reverse transcriptase zinc-binding domain-containing protein n=1 Tax=Brassica cretica TaxID=69181 RepID=A0A8S9KKZ3_BRACR|nr:hypothetical protein F2Q70_00042468 [Brassica cretica]KAF3518579.1 hypothetical protein DY000_02058752 [Brassica cretica]
MSTLDRMAIWSQGLATKYVLCKKASESRSHLFFQCDYLSQVWEYIAKEILRSSYTNDSSEIIVLISEESRKKMSQFCLQYAFQAVLYAIWRKRNKVIHGEKMMQLLVLKRMVDKGMRNKITLMSRRGTKGMERLMQYWFYTRM